MDNQTFSIKKLKELYRNGENIMQLCAGTSNYKNTSKNIEIAYDLQAGTYIDFYYKNKNFSLEAAKEKISFFDKMPQAHTILDCAAVK